MTLEEKKTFTEKLFSYYGILIEFRQSKVNKKWRAVIVEEFRRHNDRCYYPPTVAYLDLDKLLDYCVFGKSCAKSEYSIAGLLWQLRISDKVFSCFSEVVLWLTVCGKYDEIISTVIPQKKVLVKEHVGEWEHLAKKVAKKFGFKLKRESSKCTETDIRYRVLSIIKYNERDYHTSCNSDRWPMVKNKKEQDKLDQTCFHAKSREEAYKNFLGCLFMRQPVSWLFEDSDNEFYRNIPLIKTFDIESIKKILQ